MIFSRRFRDFFPEYTDKTLYGVLAFIEGSVEIQEEAQKAGLYTASVSDGVLRFTDPNGFTGKRF